MQGTVGQGRLIFIAKTFVNFSFLTTEFSFVIFCFFSVLCPHSVVKNCNFFSSLNMTLKLLIDKITLLGLSKFFSSPLLDYSTISKFKERNTISRICLLTLHC